MNWLMKWGWVALAILILAGFMLLLREEPPAQAPANSQSIPPTAIPRTSEEASRSYERPPLMPSPTPTVKPKPKPKPEPKPTVTTAPAPPVPVYTKAPANVTLACIRKHESGGNYTIVSSTGYQGAYQLSPTYSDDWAKRYGYAKWASTPAHLWPPAVQNAVALALGKDSNWTAWSKWTSYHCPGFIS